MARKSVKDQIKDVLRRYFENDDSGNKNEEFDESYAAQNAIDDIHSIVGDI